MNKPPDKPLRFRPRIVSITSSLSLLVLIALVTVTAVQWTISRKNTAELMGEVAGLLLEYMELSVRSTLEPALDQVEVVADKIRADRSNLTDRERLKTLLTGALAGTPQIRTVGVLDEDLTIFRVRRERGREWDVREADLSDDALARSIDAEMRAANDAKWGELFFRGGETMVNLRHPLRTETDWLGYILSIVTVEELSDLTTELGDDFDATAFILYGRDHVLAHPNLTFTHPEQTEDSPLVGLDRIGDLVLSKIWEGRAAPLIESDGERANIVRVSVADIDYVLVFRELTGFGEEPWIIGAWFEFNQISAVFDRLKASASVSVVVLVIALLTTFLLGRFIARPIKRVARGAALIGELEIDKVERAPHSHIRELDEQATAFNTMLASLRSFETYVPRSLVMRMISRGERQDVVSEERRLTVLFTDVAGFTNMSETLPAREVAEFLNGHFALLGSCVEAEGGTIDKFIGDALMAFWGAPDAQSDTAIHTGPVVAGNIGRPGRINYTIDGDTVNACQRLESLGKELDQGEETTVLLSGETQAELDGGFAVEQAGSFNVKGKAEELEVYRLLGRSDPHP